MIRQALAEIDTWVFDLDQTLYPHEAEIMAMVSERMTDFVARETGLERLAARALQKRYLSEHGTTLAGLMAYHGIDPYHFLNEVHDVSLDTLKPDPELNEHLDALKGKKIVFTNGDRAHALRILDHLGMQGLFDGLFYLEHASFVPKPHLDTFQRMMDAHFVDPRRAVFFEDSPKNLKPAKALGMATVLVGPEANDNQDDFIDFRSLSLKAFLRTLSLSI